MTFDFLGYNIVILIRKNDPNMTNNETKLYFKILKSLSKDSFINKKEITHFLKRYLETPVFDSQKEITQYNKNLIDFADRMQDSNHIIYSKNYLRERSKSEGIMFSSLNIYASITSDGFVFLNSYLDRKSNKRVLFFQIIITVLTTAFIGFTVYYARLTYNHIIENESIKKSIGSNNLSQKSEKTPTQQIETMPYLIIPFLQTPQVDSLKKK